MPSHCDLVPANCLDDGSRTQLVDWEYAGMNDPAWDLAYFALEGALILRSRRCFFDRMMSPSSPRSGFRFSCSCAALNHIWGLSRPEADADPIDLAPDRPCRVDRRRRASGGLAREPVMIQERRRVSEVGRSG